MNSLWVGCHLRIAIRSSVPNCCVRDGRPGHVVPNSLFITHRSSEPLTESHSSAHPSPAVEFAFIRAKKTPGKARRSSSEVAGPEWSFLTSNPDLEQKQGGVSGCTMR
jgi:hypothetical protein